MSKPRKKYNPRRWQRVAWAGGGDQMQRVLNLSSTERLTEAEISGIEHQAIASLFVLRSGFCPVAYNQMAHLYRIARIIADDMNIALLKQRADAAWQVLSDLWQAQTTVQPAQEQCDVLADLMDAMVALLPGVPRPEWLMAQDASHQQLIERMKEAYLALPTWARDGLLAVLQGGTLKAAAAKAGQTERDASMHIRAAGAIVHTLSGDKFDVPFPADIRLLRKHGPELIRKAVELESWAQMVGRTAA